MYCILTWTCSYNSSKFAKQTWLLEINSLQTAFAAGWWLLQRLDHRAKGFRTIMKSLRQQFSLNGNIMYQHQLHDYPQQPRQQLVHYARALWVLTNKTNPNRLVEQYEVLKNRLLKGVSSYSTTFTGAWDACNTQQCFWPRSIATVMETEQQYL